MINDVVRTIEATLPSLQETFDAYQREAFIARPREFFALELCGEAGELANLEKKRWKGLEIENGRFREEAADVFIALMNYCNSAEINLAVAVSEKISKIAPSNPA